MAIVQGCKSAKSSTYNQAISRN